MSSRRQRDVPWNVLGVGAAAVVALGGYMVMRGRAQEPSADPSTAAPAASSVASLEALLAAPAVSAGQDDSDPTKTQILSRHSLADAIAFARPMMTNTVGRLDTGAALFAVWASRSLTWQGLESLEETSPALFKKDPDAERGKRFCFSGTVVEIRAEKTLANRVVEDRALPLIDRPPGSAATPAATAGATYGATASPASSGASLGDVPSHGSEFAIPDGGKVFVATLMSKFEGNGVKSRAAMKDALIVEIIAVKSSGNLVDGSDARVCGVLTGVTVPPSGVVPATDSATIHRIVGMFDLPQNRTAGGGEVATQHGG